MSRVGQTSNHGMTTISQAEVAMQEKENKSSPVMKLSCPYCGELYTLSCAEYNYVDLVNLLNYFRANKCSHCKPETYRELCDIETKHEVMLCGKKVVYIKHGLKKNKVKTYEQQKGKKMSYRVR